MPVVCLIGDGGLTFSPGELKTAVDERLPITFVVWNNAGFREIEEALRDARVDPILGCHPSPLDMEDFAAACGLPFAQIAQDPGELVEMLETSLDGPRLLEIQVR